MILYHGSYIAISKPDLLHSRPYVDFGRGFYTTPFRDQAESWCNRYKRQGKKGIISIFSFEENALSRLSSLTFSSYSKEWLDFIMQCRNGQDESSYDLVLGGLQTIRYLIQ